MANSVYPINKGINRSIEFRGLRAQYIWYLAAGLIATLVLFAIFYIIGINSYLCVAFFIGSTSAVISQVYKLSHTYGQYGLMKKSARKKVPSVVKSSSRSEFMVKQSTPSHK